MRKPLIVICALVLLAQAAWLPGPMNVKTVGLRLPEVTTIGQGLGLMALTLGTATIVAVALDAAIHKSPRAERTWTIIITSAAVVAVGCMFGSQVAR